MQNGLLSFDTSRELNIQRHGNGYALVRPETVLRDKPRIENQTQPSLTLGNLLDQSFDVYLYNTEHQFQVVNEAFVRNSFISSTSSVIQKRPTEFFEFGGNDLERNNESVLTNKNIKITQEEIILSDETAQQYLSIKSPLYNEANDLVGILGVSILLGTPTLAVELNQMIELGLQLSNQQNNFFNKIDNTSFTKRQSEIIDYTLRGRSANQIAALLGLSKRTVEHYIEAIKFKLNVTTKSQLIDKLITLSKQ